MHTAHRSSDELIAEAYADFTGVPAEDLEVAADLSEDSLTPDKIIASHDLSAENRPA